MRDFKLQEVPVCLCITTMPRRPRIPPPYSKKPEGQNTMHDFFRKMDKNGGTTGRPKGARNKKGSKTNNKKKYKRRTPPPPPPPPPPRNKRSKYTNWQRGEGLLKLEEAVKTWFNTPKSERMSKNNFAKSMGIPAATLKRYLKDDATKRAIPGAYAESKSTLSTHEQELLIQCIIRRDRANEAYTRQEIITLIRRLHPGIKNRMVAGLVWNRIHAANKDRLTGRVTPQATTTKRSAITFDMMFRWHKLVDDALRRMRAQNVDDGTGVRFDDVIEHFIWNLDEECLMGNLNGTQKVICEKARRKHEKKTQDSRCSITLLRLGNAAGYQGATIILLKGQRKKEGFSDAFLERHGMTRGSTSA
jgi:hypothetical protein